MLRFALRRGRLIVLLLVAVAGGYRPAVVAQTQRANPPQNETPREAARPVAPEGVTAHRDLVYLKIGEISLALDVYVPDDAVGQLPMVVWIHGGGWRKGTKNRCPALRLAQRGYVVASVDYRLTDVAIFPAQITDCKAALRWLRAHADRYHIDPNRIGVWGSSAGGHLVALLGTSGDAEKLEGTEGNLVQSSRVQAVCDFFGPTDLLQMDAHALASAPFKHDAPDSPEALLLGGAIQEHREQAAMANPLTYVTPDDPPFLIMHGDQDPLVPLHQSQLLRNALSAAGVEATFVVVPGAGHGFNGPEIDREVDAFFDAQLKER